jgi:hypothetical protein
MIRSAGSRLLAAGAGAAVAVCSYCTVQAVVADCERLHPQVNLQNLSDWLTRRGVDIKGVGFRHTEVWCSFLSACCLEQSSSVTLMVPLRNCFLRPVTSDRYFEELWFMHRTWGQVLSLMKRFGTGGAGTGLLEQLHACRSGAHMHWQHFPPIQ